jgi:membrane protease YdiL (CAAX protease family)
VLVLASLILCVTVGTVLQLRDLLLGIIGTEILCILVPLVVTLGLLRCDLRRTLRLRWPGWTALGLAAVMAPAAAILAGEVFWLQSQIVPVPDWYVEIMDALVWAGRDAHPAVSLLALSVLPALSEEGLFRGFVLSGLGKRFGRTGALWLSALMFGLIHLDIFRFAAVCFLGVFLGYLTLASRSLYPAIVLHGINNGLILIPPEKLDELGAAWLEGNSSVPPVWLVVSVLVLVAGGALFQRAVRPGRLSRSLTEVDPGEEIR